MKRVSRMQLERDLIMCRARVEQLEERIAKHEKLHACTCKRKARINRRNAQTGKPL
jgi:hypothetical protein